MGVVKVWAPSPATRGRRTGESARTCETRVAASVSAFPWCKPHRRSLRVPSGCTTPHNLDSTRLAGAQGGTRIRGHERGGMFLRASANTDSRRGANPCASVQGLSAVCAEPLVAPPLGSGCGGRWSHHTGRCGPDPPNSVAAVVAGGRSNAPSPRAGPRRRTRAGPPWAKFRTRRCGLRHPASQRRPPHRKGRDWAFDLLEPRPRGRNHNGPACAAVGSEATKEPMAFHPAPNVCIHRNRGGAAPLSPVGNGQTTETANKSGVAGGLLHDTLVASERPDSPTARY